MVHTEREPRRDPSEFRSVHLFLEFSKTSGLPTAGEGICNRQLTDLHKEDRRERGKGSGRERDRAEEEDGGNLGRQRRTRRKAI